MVTADEAISQGYQARKEGNLLLAREQYAEGAKIYRAQNDSLNYAQAIRHVADIRCQEGDFAAAQSLYEEALELYRSNLSTKVLDLANTVRPYALLNEEQGKTEVARMLWEEARNLYGSLRIIAGVSECDAHLIRLQQA